MFEIKSKAVRETLKILVPFVLIPFAVALGALALDERNYLSISLVIAILTVVLFIAGFEKKEIGTRRMVIISVMIALSVAGRFIPFFKPVTALTVISAMYLGKESGFAVGAFSALLSNFYFGQGPWTPFQMLAWGMIGYLAGILSKPLIKSKVFLLIFGVISGVVFSVVMDLWIVIWNNEGMDASFYLSAIIAAIPHTVLYSLSNVLFLSFLSKPFGDKLVRIKIKYGI